jgi:hypothetical protein
MKKQTETPKMVWQPIRKGLMVQLEARAQALRRALGLPARRSGVRA